LEDDHPLRCGGNLHRGDSPVSAIDIAAGSLRSREAVLETGGSGTVRQGLRRGASRRRDREQRLCSGRDSGGSHPGHPRFSAGGGPPRSHAHPRHQAGPLIWWNSRPSSMKSWPWFFYPPSRCSSSGFRW
jgi:hypothetical protein